MKNNIDPGQLQKKLEEKTKNRQKKRRPKMLVSGRSVLNIQRIIKNKTK